MVIAFKYHSFSKRSFSETRAGSSVAMESAH
jgi:hypothetical protein